MTLPTIFGPLTAATGAELDADFAAVGALGAQQCSATGTNSIVLTPAANQPAAIGYGLPNPIKFGFTAPATTSGSVTLEVGALGFLPVYTINGVQATSGTLVSGNYYEVTYTTGSLYNAGAGAWVLSSYQSGTGLVVVAGSAVRGLSIVNNVATPSTKIDISFQQAALVSATGTPAFLGILSATIDLTTGTVTSTANGMDGESRPASGWVYLYAISTGSGMAGLGTTTSPLSGPPTLPAGYTYYAYLGAMRCDGSSNLLRSKQLGAGTAYTPVTASNTTIPPQMATGAVAGNTAIAVGAFVPPTASKIRVIVFATMTTNQSFALVPNNNYASATGAAAGDPFGFTNSTASPIVVNQLGELTLESTNIYYGANGTSPTISCYGWTDYVSAAGG